MTDTFIEGYTGTKTEISDIAINTRAWSGRLSGNSEPEVFEIQTDREEAPGRIRKDSEGNEVNEGITARDAGWALSKHREEQRQDRRLAKRAQGNARRAHDHVGKAIAVDVAGGGDGRTRELQITGPADRVAVQPVDSAEIKHNRNPSHHDPPLFSSERINAPAASEDA
jgi:hypothetical protein